jgi:hypothetical protein
VKEFITHCQVERFHQELGGQLIEKDAALANDNRTTGKVVCRSRLGGMLNFYHREAAWAAATTCWTSRVEPGR